MSEITRYTNSGHKFIINGDMEVGNTILVTVIPKPGYEFAQWLNGLDNITEIETDKDGNRQFEIEITECGISFAGLFNEIPALFNVIFYVNGGTGSVPSETGKRSGEVITLPTYTGTRTGYTLIPGWATTNSSVSPDYQFGDSFTINSDTTLYAVWQTKTFEITLMYGVNGEESVTTVLPFGVTPKLSDFGLISDDLKVTGYEEIIPTFSPVTEDKVYAVTYTANQSNYYYSTDAPIIQKINFSDFTEFNESIKNLGSNEIMTYTIIIVPSDKTVTLKYTSGGIESIINEGTNVQTSLVEGDFVNNLPINTRSVAYAFAGTLTTTNSQIIIN